VQNEHRSPAGVPACSAGEAHARSTIIYFLAGAFYDYFMSAAFWMGPFFADFCRHRENRKAVDNEWIARDSAGFKGMLIWAFYALQN